jgi:hypothetical protein
MNFNVATVTRNSLWGGIADTPVKIKGDLTLYFQNNPELHHMIVGIIQSDGLS